ncbi:hypothetical protein VTK26DRAFT_5712 [Humicola hyalothermophila]
MSNHGPDGLSNTPSEAFEKSPEPTDTESAEPKVKPDGTINETAQTAPEGGLRAWLVVVGSAFIFFSCLGFLNSFGVFQEYYMANQLQDRSPDDIAWIGSLMSFAQFGGGAVSGPLFDRFGSWVLCPGAALYVFALMMTSICKEYWHFTLAQGVVTGLAMSMLQVPAIAAVSQYFNKKRGAALGLAVSGSSIGGIVFPIALSKMLNDSSLSFGWSVRIMGFVVAPLLGFACFTVTARLPPRKTDFFIGRAFKDAKYVALIFALFCCMIGMFMPLFFLPTYAVARGMNATLASYLLAIVNGASTFGRIIPGMLADKYGRLNMFGLGGLVTGIVVLCFNSVTNTAGLVVYSIAFGFMSGMIISGASAAVSICTNDPRNIGTYTGMGMAIGSTAALVGPPVNGAMLDTYGGFLQASIFSGVVCLAGGLAVLAAKARTPQGIFGRV